MKHAQICLGLVFVMNSGVNHAADAAKPAVAGVTPVVNLAWQHHSDGLITTGKFSGLGQWMFTIRGHRELVACELNQLIRMPGYANSMTIGGTAEQGGKRELVVVGNTRGTVEIYDSSSLQHMKQFKVGPEYGVYAVATDREGKQIAACRTDGTVLVWKMDQADPIHHLQQTSREGERMTALAFSPDGTALATFSRYGYLALWNLADGLRIGEPVTGSTSEQTAIHFTPSGDRLLLVDRGSIGVWHPKHEPKVREILPPDEVCPRYTAEEMARPGSRPDFGHNIRFAGIMTLSPDAKRVASIVEGGKLAVWELATLKVLTTRPAPAIKQYDQPVGWYFERIAYAPNGNRVAACTTAGELVVWDLE